MKEIILIRSSFDQGVASLTIWRRGCFRPKNYFGAVGTLRYRRILLAIAYAALIQAGER